MASELTVSVSVSYLDAALTSDSLGTITGGFISSPGTLKCARNKQLVTTTEVALNLCGITAPGFCFLVNRDLTNYVQVKTATGGILVARLLANGGPGLFYFDSGAQAPFLIANSSSCYVEYLLISQ